MLHGKVGILLDISNNIVISNIIVLCQHFHYSIPLEFLFYKRKKLQVLFTCKSFWF